MNERPTLLVPANKLLVLFCGFVCKDACDDLDTDGAEPFKTTSRDQRIGILDRANNPCNARIYQSVGARRRAALMVVRLERDISSTALRTPTGLLKRDDLGVCYVIVNVCALTDDLASS